MLAAPFARPQTATYILWKAVHHSRRYLKTRAKPVPLPPEPTRRGGLRRKQKPRELIRRLVFYSREAGAIRFKLSADA
jgi:hypothetical protein